MLLYAVNLSGKINKSIGIQLIIGSTLFIISDSFIAINRFKTTAIPEHIFGVLIMATYLLGQYLIVRSIISMVRSGSSSIMGSPK